MWQDYVFMVGSFMFSLALIPAIRSRGKPPIKTSLSTGIVLAVFGVCYATLGLWLAMTANALTTICWFILFIQKLKGTHEK
jgi:hypothetical protein